MFRWAQHLSAKYPRPSHDCRTALSLADQITPRAPQTRRTERGRLPPKALAADRRQRLVGEGARHRAQLVVGAVLDGVWRQGVGELGLAEELDLVGRGLRERVRGDEDARPAEGFELDDVAQTARHAGASIGEGFDHRVAALRDVAAQVLRGRLGERRLGLAQDVMATLAQQALELVEEDVAARLADVDERDRLRLAARGQRALGRGVALGGRVENGQTHGWMLRV